MTATHLLAKPGDRTSMCGEKNPLPQVWIFWAGAHVRGHGCRICEPCWTAAGGDMVGLRAPGAITVPSDPDQGALL